MFSGRSKRNSDSMAFDFGNTKRLIRNCAYGFSCDQDWADLDLTELESVKYCNTCKREVHWCDDVNELVDCLTLNRCVSFDQNINESPPDFDDDIPF